METKQWTNWGTENFRQDRVKIAYTCEKCSYYRSYMQTLRSAKTIAVGLIIVKNPCDMQYVVQS